MKNDVSFPALIVLTLLICSISYPAYAAWIELTNDDFESGWGNYSDGGADCTRYTGGTYAHQGNAALNIQDDSTPPASTFFHTNGIDVHTNNCTQIRVEFWYYPVGMEGGEDFFVDFYDGSTWQPVGQYISGTHFNNGSFYSDTIDILETSYTFPADMKIRFRCSASGDNDDIYIDEVVVSGDIGPDTTPPTPNPAAFLSGPTAISDSEITITAVTGTDISTPIEYFFDETPDNPGGTDSGWQTSSTYTDTGLSAGTLYTYTVQMRDSIPNTGTASGTQSATTHIVVPGVIDQDQATAEANIIAAGFTVGAVTTSPSDTILKGNVMSQNPAGSSTAPPGSAIDIVISQGTARIDLEDLLEFAQNWLDSACGTCSGQDYTGDNDVDLEDFALFALEWLHGPLTIVINEFMASNDATIEDPDEAGEYPDWIELYNYGGYQIHLGGMYLNDDNNEWQIPTGVYINPGEYKLFWADRDDGLGQGPTHTSYKLNAGEDEIILKNGDEVIDSVEFRNQTTDISFGRFTDGTETWYSMSTPTPGATNVAGMAGDVYFSRLGGTFTGNFSLTLSTVSPTATIRYTTDGTMPNETSSIYSSPLSILITNGTQIVRARAYDAPLAAGRVISHYYVALDPDVQSFTSNLPIVILDSFGTDVDSNGGNIWNYNYPYEPVASVFIDVDKDTGMAGITDLPDFAGRAGAKIRGESSRNWPKKQYSFETWTEVDDEDKEVSLLGLPDESDWVLQAPYADKSLMRNVLGMKWSDDIGEYAPRFRFVELFFNQNTDGKVKLDGLNGPDYRGVYVLLEKIRIDEDRVDISRLDSGDNAEPDITGGYILRHDKNNGQEYFNTTLNLTQWGGDSDCSRFQYFEPDEFELTPQQKTWIRGFLDDFESTLLGADMTDPCGYTKYIDVKSFMDQDVIFDLSRNVDAYKFSMYMHKDRNGKLKVGPAWDYNLIFGNTDFQWDGYGSCCYNLHWTVGGRGGTAYGWYDYLRTDDEYVIAYGDNYFALRETILSQQNLTADIDYYTNMLNADGAADRNFIRWDILDSWLWPNYYFGSGSCPHTFEMEVEWMKNWISGNGTPAGCETYEMCVSDRLGWLDANWEITGAPDIIVNGTSMNTGGYISTSDQISFAAPEDVYYTTDGTDPRQVGGPINPSAILFNTGITSTTFIAQGATWKYKDDGSDLGGTGWTAIGYNDGGWSSGPAQLGYGDGDEATTVSYGSDSGNKYITTYFRNTFTVADTSAVKSLYLELLRDDGAVVYLNGTEIGRDNLPAGAINYLTTANIAMQPNAELTFVAIANVDKSLLVNGNNTVAVEVHQNSGTSSDLSFDLKLIGTVDSGGASTAFTVSKSSKVMARCKNGGDWGALNEATFSIGPVAGNLRITELMYHPTDPNDEFIELKNIGASSINLAWCEFTDGVEYTFPNWTLAAGDYALVVRNQSEFVKHYPSAASKVVGEYTGYALSNGGEEIVLRDAAGTEIHDFDYNDWYPVTDGYNFSLCIIDPAGTDPNDWDKEEGWQASSVNGGSPGVANPANVVANGSIVINEVLTHTDDLVDGDWIELHNTTGVSIDIGGWFLSDDMDDLKKYEIASGTSIPLNGYVVFTSVANFRNSAGDSGCHTEFGLSELGEEVFLSSGSGAYGGVLTGGYSITQNFGAAENDVTFGRYTKSAASGYNVDFVSMVGPTREYLNSAAKVESVVINEIMYNCSAVQDQLGEFIELKNRSGSLVILYDPVNPLNTWKFTKGIDYTFPTGISIPANDYLLVVRTDPDIFKTVYSVPGGVQVLGPFANYTELQNSGEKIELSKPGNPEPDGFVPYIRVEQVNYSDGSHPVGDDPWPISADGDGDSLNRKVDGDYGNDIDNWQPAPPTPGS